MKKLYVRNDDGTFEEVAAIVAGREFSTIIRTRIDDAIQKYVKNCTAKKCIKNQNTEKLYFGILKSFLLGFKINHIDEVTRDHIDQFETFLLKKMKPNSVNRRFCSIKNFFSKCIEWKFILESPCQGLKRRKVEKNPYKPWSPELFEKFIAQTSGQWRNIFNFLWLTGCRPMEAKNLRWSDIDYDDQVLILRCGKNAYFTRKFPITKTLDQFLHTLKMNGPYVFADENRNPINNDQLYHYCKKRLNRLGCKSFTVYGIRHGFGTKLASQGVNSFYIAELMGHTDLKTTRGYVHTDKKLLIDVLNKAK